MVEVFDVTLEAGDDLLGKEGLHLPSTSLDVFSRLNILLMFPQPGHLACTDTVDILDILKRLQVLDLTEFRGVRCDPGWWR